MKLVRVLAGVGVTAALALAGWTVGGAAGAAPADTTTAATTTGVTCNGQITKLLDTSNGFGVLNGGKPPSFSTNGQAYCVTQIITYHWNNGLGKKPGTLALRSGTRTVGPFKAKGTAGQNNAQNVNWIVSLTTTSPVVINGTYQCVDSDPASWSQNQQSKGTGFCQVYGVAAQGNVPKPEPPPPTTTAAPAGKGKLSIKATPDSGNPPLAVKFALKSPKCVEWRVDFGDGKSTYALGAPPKTLAHTYAAAGDYRPRLSIIETPKDKSAKTATTSVQVGTALATFSAKPASGNPPLKVTFTLGTSVKNISSWAIAFGDGARDGGVGTPPKTVTHTYAKAGTYVANFAVKPGAYALVAAYAQVVVGGGTPPTLSLTASPTSGAKPLKVTFALSSNIPGQVVSWKLTFGDGSQTGGSGKPPASVTHTYAKPGTFLAFLAVAQQQAYGGVQFVVPRTGLAITVR